MGIMEAVSVRPSTRRVYPELNNLLIGAIEVGPDNGPAELVDLLLRDAMRERVSDIHFEPNSDGWRLRVRIDGSLFDTAHLSRDVGVRMIRHLKVLSGLESVTAIGPADGRRSYLVDGRELDLRLAVAPSLDGEILVLRLLQRDGLMRDLGTLGLSQRRLDTLRNWATHVHGMVLVVGPTGSGKTTTVYSLLKELPGNGRAMATIEDPVEYRMEGVTQIQVNARTGLGFADAVRAMSRLDKDVLLVGELRDPESARAAIEAAGRGRIVLATMHSRDAVSAIRVLRSWGLGDAEIAGALDMVIAQRLVRTLCPTCRRAELPRDVDRVWFQSLGFRLPEQTWEPAGCDACRGLGYAGRTGAFEVWQLKGSDYQNILEHRDEMEIRKTLRQRHHRSLLDDGLSKARQGLTSLEELKTLATFYAPRTSGLDPEALESGDELRFVKR